MEIKTKINLKYLRIDAVSSTDRELFFRIEFWKEATHQSKGYEDESLINSYVESLRQNPPWKRKDNLYFTNREIELTCAIHNALAFSPPTASTTNVRVLDFGGGNGYLGVAVRHMVPRVNWEWLVIESNACVRAYSQFENEASIKWISDENFDWKSTSKIGLVSCTLQYLEYPEKTLRKIAKSCDFIILMRLPFVDSISHILTRQTFYEGLHQVPDASWPHWFFSRHRLFDLITDIGDVIYQWKTPTESYIFEGNTIFLEGVLIKTHTNIKSISKGVTT
jgi:putative methyltransferase (TIGR04325 family)